jgi:hypothetical protein
MKQQQQQQQRGELESLVFAKPCKYQTAAAAAAG